MKRHFPRKRSNFAVDFAKFLFLFVILIVAVFSVKYTGIFDPDTPEATPGSSPTSGASPAPSSPASGQEVPHLHIHVIPRVSGDGRTPVLKKTSYEDGEIAAYGEKLRI